MIGLSLGLVKALIRRAGVIDLAALESGLGYISGLGPVCHVEGPSDQDLRLCSNQGRFARLLAPDSLTDIAPGQVIIKGGSAVPGAAANRNGANVDVIPGANAAGGVDGIFRVLHPDQAAGDHILLRHDGTDAYVTPGSGRLLLFPAPGGSSVNLLDQAGNVIYRTPLNEGVFGNFNQRHISNDWVFKPTNAGLVFASDNPLSWSATTNAVSGTADVVFNRVAAAVLRLSQDGTDTNGAALQIPEMTAPTGVGNTGRLFTEDNGAGKTRLMVIFGTGASQQIAIEP